MRVFVSKYVQNLAIVDAADRQAEVQKKLGDEFSGKQIIYIKADIGKLTELELAFKQATEKFDGQLDVVINTAGIFNDKDVNATLTVNAVCTECKVRDTVRIELTMY